MQEWEYDIWYLDPSRGTSSIRDELERRGREGWELVATPVAWDFDRAGDGRQLVGILKRSVRAELTVAAPRELAPGDVIYDPGPRMEPATDLALLPDDPSAVEVVDAMIRRVKADLVANRRERVVADDKHKKLRTTHLRVELHLLKQSRTWVKTDADLAWVRSGLEAWRSAYGLRQPRRLEWLSRLRESGPAVAMAAVERDARGGLRRRRRAARAARAHAGPQDRASARPGVRSLGHRPRPEPDGCRGRGGTDAGRTAEGDRTCADRRRPRADARERSHPARRDVVRGYWRTSRRSRPTAATTTSTTVNATRTTHPVQGTPSRSGLRPSAW